jgi:hypothetical protein
VVQSVRLIEEVMSKAPPAVCTVSHFVFVNHVAVL